MNVQGSSEEQPPQQVQQEVQQGEHGVTENGATEHNATEHNATEQGANQSIPSHEVASSVNQTDHDVEATAPMDAAESDDDPKKAAEAETSVSASSLEPSATKQTSSLAEPAQGAAGDSLTSVHQTSSQPQDAAHPVDSTISAAPLPGDDAASTFLQQTFQSFEKDHSSVAASTTPAKSTSVPDMDGESANRKRTRRDPRDGEAWLGLISEALQTGDLEQSRKVYEEFFVIFPNAVSMTSPSRCTD